MQWDQVMTFIGVNVAMFGMIAGLVVWAINKIDTDVKSICTRLDRMDARFEGHASRIDQLYQMFVSLLKEKK